jgi:anti-sigma factor (TIGR02949 family)
MNCIEFEAHLDPYVDGELSAGETAAADAHRAECWHCAALAQRERDFRQLLRRQPRESAPAQFRARVIERVRAEHRRSAVLRPWLVAPALAATAAIVIATVLPTFRPGAPPLVGDLVDKHIAYAQVERPAEIASGNPGEIAEWFRRRAGLRVTVPDYSLSGIHLIGARLADAHERQAAYLLYEKGRTLLSVFMVPVSERQASLLGARASYRGQEYVTGEHKGYRTVAWADREAVFGIVSRLDYEALLECADRLRIERADASRL